MIKNLLIKNYALIELLELEFESGLNVLTGETGAGKSIIIDALSLLLGDRASTEIIRSGADKAVIEGIFEIGKNKKIQKLLSNNQLETNEEQIGRASCRERV